MCTGPVDKRYTPVSDTYAKNLQQESMRLPSNSNLLCTSTITFDVRLECGRLA